MGGGDSYLLLSFLPVVGLCFIDCQSRGIIGIRKSLIEAMAKFYYDEPKSPVLTPPSPHSSSQAMNDDKTKSWCVVLSLYKTHCLKITSTQT